MIKRKIGNILVSASIVCSAITPDAISANATQVVSKRTTTSIGVVTAKSGLNLRKSASTSSKILKTIPCNGQVKIKSESGSWYYVEYNKTNGYVSKSYIKRTSSSNSSTQTQTTSTQTQTSGTGKVTAKSGLNLRKSASTSSKILKTIPYNGQVKIKSESGSWYYVEYNKTNGYVSKSYIKRTSSSNLNTQTSSKYDKILSAMKSQIGKPYRYGGSSPSTGFDCSGFMQWGFKQGGINIGRTTYDQIKNGSAVSINSVKPGDLLFRSNKGHVGMYIGNGKWIESPSSGKTVRISDVSWNTIGYARRVIN